MPENYKIPAAKALETIFKEFESVAKISGSTRWPTLELRINCRDEKDHLLFMGSLSSMLIINSWDEIVYQKEFCTNLRGECFIWNGELDKCMNTIREQIRLSQVNTRKYNLHQFRKAGGLL